MSAYYNEIDPFAAEWLENLCVAGLIADGDVDRRSIEDVSPDDLRGYTQVHAFAGIGVWSYALRKAGWSDDRPVWTGSCPCQPFSQAGQGAGFADERHLWPAWFWLIEQRRPDRIFGEQVASKDGLAWFDLVSTDLEGAGYTVGASDQCVAGFGGPHIRQRLWFVGLRDAGHAELQGRQRAAADDDRRRGAGLVEGGFAASSSGAGGLPDGQGDGRTGRSNDSDEGRRERAPGSDGATGRLPDDDDARPQVGSLSAIEPGALRFKGSALGADEPVRGFWSGADWIWFRDGKYRPVEPGTFPLAHGASSRVGRLRAYGNAINAEVAKGFIEAAMTCMP